MKCETAKARSQHTCFIAKAAISLLNESNTLALRISLDRLINFLAFRITDTAFSSTTYVILPYLRYYRIVPAL